MTALRRRIGRRHRYLTLSRRKRVAAIALTLAAQASGITTPGEDATCQDAWTDPVTGVAYENWCSQ